MLELELRRLDQLQTAIYADALQGDLSSQQMLPLQRAMAVAIKGDAIKSDLSEVLEAGPPMLGGMNFSFV